MAFYDTTWYCNAGDQSTTGHYAVAKWATGATIAAGALRRQLAAPTVGNERVFVCIVAGTTHATTEPTWVLTRGAKTTDNTVTWQECTGASAVNGDLTNTANWTTAKATGTPTLGAIIKRNNGASYQICSTAGTLGASEPAFSDTAGTTTTEGTTTWTSLGAVSNFTGGQAPHARLANVSGSNWMAAGNTVYVGDNHAESQATTLTVGIVSTPIPFITKFLCHNHAGSYPPAASDITTGATISSTAAVTVNGSGSLYVYGLTFKAGVGSSSALALNLNGTVNSWSYYDNCSFWNLSTASSAFNNIGVNGSSGANQCIWNNCTVRVGNAATFVYPVTCSFIWQNTGPVLASGSTVPTALIGIQTNGNFSNVTLEALDLSQITTNIFGTNNTNEAGSRIVRDCKLNAAVTVQQGGVTSVALVEQIVRCDSGATAYKSARYSVAGTETTETSITRVGGAVDPTGQAQTRKIVTTANAQWLRPFQAEPYAIWNTTTGATVTVTVYGTVNAGAVPNNDDLWLEVCFLGSGSQPLGTIVTTTKASLLATNAAVASDGSSWNGGGSGAGWSPFKLVATLSSPQPGMAGYIDVRVRTAKASTTYYIDPKIELT